MEFMSAKEAADKWGISQRRVDILCSENRIKNAAMVDNRWVISYFTLNFDGAESRRYYICDGKNVNTLRS